MHITVQQHPGIISTLAFSVLVTCLFAAAAAGSTAAPIKHVIVYKEPGRFCGWPANNGIWSWSNEILVGFHLDYYKENTRGHSIDRSKPRERVLTRSFDGGLTWKLEKPEGLNSKKQPVPCPGGVDFTHPDFALTCRGDDFHFSYDRGKTWRGPQNLPDFGQKNIMARTDYIVNGQGDCLIFLTASKTNGKEGRPFCARTTDGFKTLNFISWIGPEPEGFSIMPSTVRCSRTKLVSAVRRKEQGLGFIEVYASNDDGRTWQLLSTPAGTGRKNGNPPSTVRLPDGRIVVAYGYRSPPQGIRAIISSDEGKTWSNEIVLRRDGRTWDLGYPQTVQRPDGKLVTIYYFTTEENPQQHIAATIWDPDVVFAMGLSRRAKKETRPQATTEDKDTAKLGHSKPPGVVIDYLPSQLKNYVGSPAIAVLPNGRYVASHDIFGDTPRSGRTCIFESADSGRTWQPLAELRGQYWSSLFVHRGRLYIIGTSRKHGDIVIRRSTDGGKTWTEPRDERAGLLAEGRFHCAPVPVVEHNGRIWRAFEVDGGHYRWEAFVMSAPAEANLLNAENWLMSNKLLVDKRANIFKWLEGNVVVTPDDKLVNILRTQAPPARAAMVHISADGQELSFDPAKDLIAFPGGAKKFTIRYDKVAGKYWSLVNIITDPGPLEEPPQDHRNTLALTCSKDLRKWKVRYIALSFRQGEHLTRENNKFGFQYVDWLIEGNDIILVSRTAWGWDTPRSHDANYLTFHRINDFRQKTLKDEPLYSGPSSARGALSK